MIVSYLLSVAKCSSSCALVIFDNPFTGVAFDLALEVFDFFFLGTITFKASTSAVSSFRNFKAVAFFAFVQLYIALFTADFVSARTDFDDDFDIGKMVLMRGGLAYLSCCMF